MRMTSSRAMALASAGAALAAFAPSQTSPFAPPVRMQAGAKFLGEGRLYPSPVFHDFDGDGRLDVVVGDLPGRLTVALRLPGDGPPGYAAEKKVNAADGKEIDFHNW